MTLSPRPFLLHSSRTTTTTTKLTLKLPLLILVLLLSSFPLSSYASSTILDGTHPRLYYVTVMVEDEGSSTESTTRRRTDELLLRYEPPLTSEYHPGMNHQYHQQHHKQQQQEEADAKGNYKLRPTDWLPYYEFPTTPRYFWGLEDDEIEQEVIYHLQFGQWSDRVVLEKLYFGLLYGLTGLPEEDDNLPALTPSSGVAAAAAAVDSQPLPQQQPPLRAGSGGDGTSTTTSTSTSTTSTTTRTLFRPPTTFTVSSSNPRDILQLESAAGWDVFDRQSNYCEWEGIVCEYPSIPSPPAPLVVGETELEPPGIIATSPPPPPPVVVTEIRLASFALKGTLPPELYLLTGLKHVDFKGNFLQGSIPNTWVKLTQLSSLCLAVNHLTGTIPNEIAQGWSANLQYLWLSNNRLTGTIPNWMFMDAHWEQLLLLDVSSNQLRGPLPPFPRFSTPLLQHFFVEQNQLTGHIPSSPTIVQTFKSLQVVDLGYNNFKGTIPTHWMKLPQLRDFNVAGNLLTGKLPSELLQLTTLEVMVVSDNRLTGEIPRGDDIIPGVGRVHHEAPVGGQWSDLIHLKLILWNNNNIHGKIPPEMLYGLRNSLTRLNIGYNKLVGTIPPEIGAMTKLTRLDAQGNYLSGTLPDEMNKMNQNLELNLTNNLLVGSVPKIFCGAGFLSVNLLYRLFDCDAVLCPAGTFHPTGAATLQAGCRPCPHDFESDDLERSMRLSKLLGRNSCPKVKFVNGDLNGDGKLSPREILMLLFVETIGRNWGAQFQTWADMRIKECDLYGIQCAADQIGKIDLTDAALCSNGERKAGPADECHGIPAELSLLTALEVVSFNRRQFLRGTLPPELGKLTKLKYLDISSCPMMNGPIPSELGRLTNLKYLNLGGCRFNGTIPTEIFRLTQLEKLHLSMNLLTGSLPSTIGRLGKLKEFMLSRTQIGGVLPVEIGAMTSLENLEMYGNQLYGSIPESLANCTSLKRIDLFDNKLTGSLPESFSNLEALQILHLKLNKLTGTISSQFGELPFLSWFDVSTNKLHGTIPASFGSSKSIKDFRLGGNMIYEPIPHSLCTNTNINGGLTRNYGCDGVICPLGTFSDPGHATHSNGCNPCPEGQTNMYLGSSSCQELSQADILSVYFDVIRGDQWNALQQLHWKDRSVDICEWYGVSCDEDGEIQSLRIPVAGLDDAEL